MPTIEARTNQDPPVPGSRLGVHPVDTLYPPLDMKGHNLIVDCRGRPALLSVLHPPQHIAGGLLGPTPSEQRLANAFEGQKLRKLNPVLRAAAWVGVVALGTLGVSHFLADSASAQDPVDNNFCPPGQEPAFVLGFADLREAVGKVMGDPLTCEYNDPKGS